MKKRHGKLVFFAVLLILILVLSLHIYMDRHREDWLTRDDALGMAMKDAGVKDGLAYDVSIRLSTEDGEITYYISFTNHIAQFFYEIDAQTGEILSKDRIDSE